MEKDDRDMDPRDETPERPAEDGESHLLNKGGGNDELWMRIVKSVALAEFDFENRVKRGIWLGDERW